MECIKSRANVIYLIGILFLISSCSGTKHLSESDLILTKNTFKLTSLDVQVDKTEVMEGLRTLIKQTPVKKNPLNIRAWRKPVTIYDRDMTIESAESFQQYLRNRKGFYHAIVDYNEVRNSKRDMEVVYTIDLGHRYYINSFKYESDDSVMQSIIMEYAIDSEIKAGQPLDADRFELEKARIVNVLKNEGYANFNSNYIEYIGDSSNYKADLAMHIDNPVGRDHHIQYKVGDINIYTEHTLSVDPFVNTVDTIGQHRYYAKTNQFLVQPKSLDDVLAFSSGELFNKNKETKTNQNLSRLSPYRFAEIKPYTTSDTSELLNYNIFLTPHQNKWIMDTGLNLFYSSVNTSVGRNLFGFAGNLSFQNRNFKNKAIRHSIGLEGTFEFNLPNLPRLDSIVSNTISLQLSNKFDIPKVVDIFKITNVLNRLNVISNESLQNLSANGTTTIDMSVGYISIANYYDLISLNASWSYNFQPSSRLRYTIKQIGVNVIDTKIQESFQKNILDDNLLLARSFDDNLFTGFLFRELSVARQSEKTRGGSQWLFLGNIEQSGFENFLLNKTVNLVSGYNDNWTIGGLQFADFVRLEGDIRYYKDVKDRSSFASRLNIALAVPYNGDQVPYIKQYFVGGPNSIRGWQLRQLGPGTYNQDADLNNQAGAAYYQSGDFKLDFSAEYRFDLFWYFEGAVFLDGGNVWLLKEDNRPGSQLTFGFLDQVALATGWGIRMDFDYFIFRFDFGYKLRNPIADPETGRRIVLFDKNYNKSVLGNISFAINYPF
jgi:outer membrane protein insertion porin family